MKIWDLSVDREFTGFLAGHGVNLPRAWSLHCRQENHRFLREKRSFEAFLIAEHPVEMAKWRIMGNEPKR